MREPPLWGERSDMAREIRHGVRDQTWGKKSDMGSFRDAGALKLTFVYVLTNDKSTV
jgi:hypothetical protein